MAPHALQNLTRISLPWTILLLKMTSSLPQTRQLSCCSDISAFAAIQVHFKLSDTAVSLRYFSRASLSSTRKYWPIESIVCSSKLGWLIFSGILVCAEGTKHVKNVFADMGL